MHTQRSVTTTVLFAALLLAGTAAAAERPAAPPPKNDEAYGAKIREFTTEKFFLTELIDHLPASATVPDPAKFLGHIAGAPDTLTYSKDIYAYLRALEKVSPRVRVLTMGKTEEGREMIVALVSAEANLAKLDRFREITAKLADPRRTTPAEAKALIAEGVPFYWASGSIHSPETGSPEMLMELAYRLAVEETPFIEAIRKNCIVMITPLVEVDGHDREVDVYRFRKANPDKTAPDLLYWGKYVVHDNNRDGMSLALALSRNIVKTFLDFHPQVLHDLHESVPFLYISTGMGPYNAWLDPIVINEWHELAYHEIDQMTRRGVPGVWTHGFYDGWAANYMFYAANGHNAIGRFYETFGGRGADTFERTVPPSTTSRAWFRPDPPLPKVKWSLRNNVNLQQSALLFAMNFVAGEKEHFLENFYAKSRRSVEKATVEGPAAWAIPANDPRPVECAELVNLLRLHGVEVHRSDAGFKTKDFSLPGGSYVIRMDQPYSRMADMMLDTQYYNPADPRPYDDTGWSLGPLRNVTTERITDAGVLKARMTLIAAPVKIRGGVEGPASAAVWVIDHNTDNTLATLAFSLKGVAMKAAEQPFKAAGREFHAGSLILDRSARARFEPLAAELGLRAYGLKKVPAVATHTLEAPRVALVHTWDDTQNEGWVRLALDGLNIPYAYISVHALRDTPDLRAHYDVIFFGPTGGSAQGILNGIPMRGAPIPWQKSDLTPNVGTSPDQTADMRGGPGLEGMANLKRFVEGGGVFITVGGNASIPIDFGFVEGVSINRTKELQAHGAVFNAVFTDRSSPIAYGYADRLAVYFDQEPVLQVSPTAGLGAGGYFDRQEAPKSRPSGRGAPSDADTPQGRVYVAPPAKPELKPGEEPPIPEEYLELVKPLLPGPESRPRVVLRFALEKDLLVSGMLAGAKELENRPAVVDLPLGKGHVVMFAINPMWRQETQGSFFLVFNAMLHWNHLGAGVAQK